MNKQNRLLSKKEYQELWQQEKVKEQIFRSHLVGSVCMVYNS